MILYCVPAFHKILSKKWAQKKLDQIQRGYLIRIIRGYRTTSTAAAQIISGIEPLYLSWLYKANVFNVKQDKKIPEQLLNLEIETAVSPLLAGHPSYFSNCLLDNCSSRNHHYAIYTDGSS